MKPGLGIPTNSYQALVNSYPTLTFKKDGNVVTVSDESNKVIQLNYDFISIERNNSFTRKLLTKKFGKI